MPSTNISPKEVLKHKTIVVVGASKNPEKEAHSVPAYLQRHGYKIIPVNPTADTILGERAFASLLDLPADLASKAETVEVFRPSEDLPEIARQAVKLKERYGMPLAFWAQLGLESDEAKKILDEGNIPYVMDRCMKVEHGRMS
jgi:predicted CoA-binding protein